MKDAQTRLDAGQKLARATEDSARNLAAQLRAGADEVCAVASSVGLGGNPDPIFEASACVREAAAEYEAAAASMSRGYAILRRLRLPTPTGIVRPASRKD